MGKSKNEKKSKNGLVGMDDFQKWFADPFPRFLGDPFREFGMRGGIIRELASRGFSIPRIDVQDNGDSFVIEADMPSVDKKDIELKISEDTLAIKAQKSREEEHSSNNFYSKERSSSGYYRIVKLPAEVNSDSAKALYKDGTLVISVKKARKTTTHKVKVE